jgi:DNA ligase 1
VNGLAAFVALFEALDRTTATTGKRAALERYLREAAPVDAVWAIHFLTGRRMRRPVSGRLLRDWAAEESGLPPWLVEECLHVVGDGAEAMAILCARGTTAGREGDDNQSLADFVQSELLPLARLTPEQQRAIVTGWWRRFDERTAFVVHKLLTGEFRVGVSATLVAKALAKMLDQEPAAVEHRLMGTWSPDADFAARLFAPEDTRSERSRPYPFFLASPLDANAESLGDPREWIAEWKWDGIRAQLIVRGGDIFIWSRGEELVTDRFPELVAAARALPEGTVLDGEILPWKEGEEGPHPFSVLQTRIGRRTLTQNVLRNAPVVMVCFDVIEYEGRDLREESLDTRKTILEGLLRERGAALRLSPVVPLDEWSVLTTRREESRARGVEGIMLKRRSSPYRVGRPRGDWWKWKVKPYTMDAVLIYAQSGHGRRAALYTDYTFAVWDGDSLVPVAKAYSGLDDAEIRRLDSWIRQNTIDRFGPVRSVTPHFVFELGFEAIQHSTRHKSGIAVRFPRILRWRDDKGIRDADTLADLHAMIESAARENPARARPPQSAMPSLFDGMLAETADDNETVAADQSRDVNTTINDRDASNA